MKKNQSRGRRPATHRPAAPVCIPYRDLEFAKLDVDRDRRCAIPEAIFGARKTIAELETITRRLLRDNRKVLITRLDQDKYRRLKKKFPSLRGYATGDCSVLFQKPVRMPGSAGCQPGNHAPDTSGLRPVIITAGTSDQPVAREASATLQVMGYQPREIFDIGVAGLHRLLDNLTEIRTADVVIAVAGMDGVLPGVVANLVKAPVIGVPVSVGYGTGAMGISALLTMLNSCSGKLAVCNIDNGFSAGCIAISILEKIRERMRV